MIRIIGKICYELLDNGGMNWDREYRKLANALAGYLKTGVAAQEEIISLAKGICADSAEEELYLLNEACVKWVLANPQPVRLDSVEYKR